jgi:hypothetical protein
MAWGKTRMLARVTEATLPLLEPEEQVKATAYAMSGPNPLLLAELGGIWLRMLLQKLYFITVTDRRVLFVKASMWTNRPKGLAFAYPRDVVGVISASRGFIFYVLKLRIVGRKDLRLNFNRNWRQEADAIAAAIGGAAQTATAIV